METIEIIQGDDFRRTVYQFRFNHHTMKVDLRLWSVQERATKRHKWQVVNEWSYWRQDRQVIKRRDVVIPDDVSAEALRQIRDSITME